CSLELKLSRFQNQLKDFKEQSIQVNYDNNNHDVVTQGLNPNCYTNTTVSLLNTLNEQKSIYYQSKRQEEQERQERFLYGQDQYDNRTKGKKGDPLASLTPVQFNSSSNSYKLNDPNQQKVTFSRSSSFYYDETGLTTVAMPVFEAAKRQGEFYLVRYVDEERGYALLFETPKVGMMMQMYLPLTQRNQAPYPPVCVTRVTGDCVVEWEDIENERKNRNEVDIVQNTAETVERDSKGRSQLKSMLYQSLSSYGFQPRSFYGFQPKSQYGIQSFYNVATVANTADTEKEEEENETEFDWLTDPGYSREQNVDQKQQPHLTRFQSFFGIFDQSITDNKQSNNSIILGHNKYENECFRRTELKALKKVGNKQNQFNSQEDLDESDKFGEGGEQFQWEGEQFYYNHLALFREMGDGDDYEDWSRDQKKMQQQGIQAYGQQYRGQLSNTSSQYGYGYGYSGMQTENKVKYSPSELADMMLDQNQLIQQQMVDPSYLPPLDRYLLCKPQGDQDYLKYQYEATILPNTDLPTDEQLQKIEEDDEDAYNQNPDLNLSTKLWGADAPAQDPQQSKKREEQK
ncbi:MAG: hypothetical protein EZS28_036118, partial [Streblomastix strix]